MNRSDEMKFKRGIAALGALLVATSILSPASAHETGAAPYTMATFIDDAYGRTIVSGNYDMAIKKITARVHRAPERLTDQNNLCVAYAKAKETEKALAACDAAVTLAKMQESRATRKYHDRSLMVRATRSDLAIALSNRGVLLAATGNSERAREDFVAAIHFETSFAKTVAANLDRLDKMRAPEA